MFNGKVFAMDAKFPAVVVTTSDRLIHVFDLTSGLNKIAEYKCPVDKYQARSLAIFADNKGFAVGTVEGRVAIEVFSEMSKKNTTDPNQKNSNSPNFQYKCHRDKRNDGGFHVYSVNSLSFHPLNTFCTGGSDGVIAFWDKDARLIKYSILLLLLYIHILNIIILLYK